MRPNSPPQTTSVVSSRPRDLRSVSRAAIGWSTARALFSWPWLQVGVLVPAVAADGRTQELDEAHAPLDQAPRDQAFASEDLCGGIRVVEPVKPLRGRRFAGKADELGNGGLHAVGELVIGDRRLERVMMADPAEHALVERAQQLELAQLQRSGLVRPG